MSIPKKIHFCWFGKRKLSALAEKCLDSWEKHLTDYEVILWNEDNFDISVNQYVREAYETEKFAFVTDYVRLYALYHHGGIYMDTDVEVLKPLDRFLNHRAFIGCEQDTFLQTAIIGSEQRHPWIEKIMDYYDNEKFILSNGELNTIPNPQIITPITVNEYGWIAENRYQVLSDDLNVYPIEYFCAKDYRTGRINITANTYTVHHFSGTWLSNVDKFKIKTKKILGPNIIETILRCKTKFFR